MGGVKRLVSVQHFFLQTKTTWRFKGTIDLRKKLKKYIGKLGSTVVNSKIQLSVNYMFQRIKKKKKKTRKTKSTNDKVSLLPVATFDSKTGEFLKKENLEIKPESSENSIYLRQNLRIVKSNCLTFFDSGANEHLFNRSLAKRENLQKFSDDRAHLGVIGGGVITAESDNFHFNLGSGKDGVYHEIRAFGIKNVTMEFGEYGLEELGKEFMSSAPGLENEYVLPKTVGGSKVHLTE